MLWPVLILIPFTALAMGAVHPWAYSALELTAYATGVLWMLQIAVGKRVWAWLDRDFGALVVSMAALPVIIAIQLLPMPPSLLKFVSPGGYSAYSEALPGWPERSVYGWVNARSTSSDAHRQPQPAEEEGRFGAAVPFRPDRERSAAVGSARLLARAWLPVSVAPEITERALLKVLAYLVIFSVVLFYTSDSGNDSRFDTTFVTVVLLTGLTIGLIGLSQPMFSNGKPLWIFHPYDWGDGLPWGDRLFGTFANPDHYADYLAMAWSFAVAGLVFPSIFGFARNKFAGPLLFGTVGATVLAALIGTASRGGWLGAFGATLTILWYANRLPIGARPWFTRYRYAGKRLLVAASLGFGILCAALFFTNVASRTEASGRASDLVRRESLTQRLEPARNSLSMSAQMPLLGAGMGSWPLIYPRYSSPPWNGMFMNAAHDEYAQFTSEMGLVGLLVVGFAVWFAVRILRRSVVSPEAAGISACCAGAVAAIGLHSIFDFPLRIPANALLAVACLALLLRVSSPNAKQERKSIPVISRVCAVIVAVVLIVAGWSALKQPSKPFPYDLDTPLTLAAAVNNIFRYPTFPPVHLQLAQLLYDQQDGAKYRQMETSAVLALDPLNPIARDMRAHDLVLAGGHSKALKEMELSVANAPAIEFHAYLDGRYLLLLSKDERSAVIAGLSSAVRDNYWPAADTLMSVYETFGMYDDEAELMSDIARREMNGALKSDELSKAGLAFAKAGKSDEAKKTLELAIGVDPGNPGAYRILATEVYGREKEFARARQTIDRGISSGVPATPLYLALADVEVQNQDPSAAEKALEQAVALEPFNFEIVRRLGLTYLSDRKYDDAAVWLRKAAELKPAFAQAYFELGLAEENDYQYSAAGKAFARANALASQNSEYATHYVEFKKKVESARSQ